jgi:hypothetical protein
MMQPCASAPKLRSGGPNLPFGMEAKETRRDRFKPLPDRLRMTAGAARYSLACASAPVMRSSNSVVISSCRAR